MQFDEGDDLMKIKNNTIIGTDPDMLSQQEMLKAMLNKNMINLPGQTPMNTQMGDEEDNRY